jgi:hypothetical protein
VAFLRLELVAVVRVLVQPVVLQVVVQVLGRLFRRFSYSIFIRSLMFLKCMYLME